MKKIVELTWEELDLMDKNKSLVFLSIAPIEEHGKHLPLGVDIFETEKWQNDTIKQIESTFSELTCITLPIIPVGFASLGNFVGNFHILLNTLKNLVYECVHNIAKWGFKNIIVLSGHADPMHLVAIEEMCDSVNSIFGEISIAPMGSIFSAHEKNLKLEYESSVDELTQKYPFDFHGGWIETSSMLDINKQLVKDTYLDMMDIEVLPQEMMCPIVVEEKIKCYGHIGYPSKASGDVGRKLNDHMAYNLFSVISAFIKKENYIQYKHHFLFDKLKGKSIAPKQSSNVS